MTQQFLSKYYLGNVWRKNYQLEYISTRCLARYSTFDLTYIQVEFEKINPEKMNTR